MRFLTTAWSYHGGWKGAPFHVADDLDWKRHENSHTIEYGGNCASQRLPTGRPNATASKTHWQNLQGKVLLPQECKAHRMRVAA